MKTIQRMTDRLKDEFSYMWNLVGEDSIEYSIGDISIPAGSEFSERNPVTKVEIWKNKGVSLIRSEWALVRREPQKTVVIFKEESDISVKYGVIRSEFTNLLRSKLSKMTLCSVHAACVRKNGEVILIIGSKGTGKSSSSIYFHNSGGDIYTDELVFFDESGNLICLPRLIGVDEQTLFRYFPQYQHRIQTEISSMYNTEKKVLLDIMAHPEKALKLDKVILLVKGSVENISPLDKIALISEQWMTYDNGEKSEHVLREIIKKAKPMTLTQLRENEFI